MFTRRWMVDLILDLVGYTAGEGPRSSQRLVEPSCGTGAFLVPIVERLIASCREHGRPTSSLGDASERSTCSTSNASEPERRSRRLEEAGLDQATADAVAESWVTTGDFLLTDHEPRSVAYVVGNPPYIRLENVRLR